jgi:hypothetical protein
MTKAPHHRGSYHRRSLALVAAAYRDPTTRCWRCGRTLAEHPNTTTGNPPKWSAGHVIKGQVDGQLLPEVLSCNVRAENAHRKAMRSAPRTTRRRW